MRPGPTTYDRLYGEFPRLYRSQKAMFARLNRTGRNDATIATILSR